MFQAYTIQSKSCLYTTTSTRDNMSSVTYEANSIFFNSTYSVTKIHHSTSIIYPFPTVLDTPIDNQAIISDSTFNLYDLNSFPMSFNKVTTHYTLLTNFGKSIVH